jgi:hypothetical protein
MVSNWFCADCDRIMSDYGEVGYDGPAEYGEPVDLPCDSFPLEWIVLCQECAKKRGVNDEN